MRHIDGIPPKRKRIPDSSPKTASSDFLSKRFESVVFSRDHRALRRSVFGRVSRNVEVSKSRIRRLDDIRRFSAVSPSIRESTSKKSLSDRFRSRYREALRTLEGGLVRVGAMVQLSPRATLRFSLLGAILFGAVSATAAYRYLGERAFARESSAQALVILPDHSLKPIPDKPMVLGESDQNDDRLVNEVVSDLEDMRKAREKSMLEAKIREMVAGYPIEGMVPFIMEKDKIVASFLVGIAKKESAWGKRVPLMNEHDCFNYWGYRGKRRFMGTGGHTCFNSAKDAVDTVSRRLEKLIYTEKVDTPAEMMVVWKCGYDCSTHTKADTKKWVQDVDLYFHQLDEDS